MELENYLGMKFDEAIISLNSMGRTLQIIDCLPPRGDKIGDEKRIVNIKEDGEKILIYVSYF